MPSGVETPQPLGQPVHCTTLPARNFLLVSNCNLFSCNLWLLPLGFPVPASGKGMCFPITPLLQRWAADSCSVCFPSASSGTFLQSCSPHLVLMNSVTQSQGQERGFIFTELHEVSVNHSCSLNRGSAHLSINCCSLKFVSSADTVRVQLLFTQAV